MSNRQFVRDSTGYTFAVDCDLTEPHSRGPLTARGVTRELPEPTVDQASIDTWDNPTDGLAWDWASVND